MKIDRCIHWSSALLLSLGVLQAQETSQAEKLGQQLKEMQERFQSEQRQMREQFEKMLREQQAQIDALKQQLEAAKSNVVAHDTASEAEKQKPANELRRELAAAPSAGSISSGSTLPAQGGVPLRLGSGSAYADFGLVGTFAAGTSTADDIEGGTQPGGHDPNQRGFTVQGVELSAAGAVDPYFRGNANLLFSMDSGGESFFELEEAWLESFSLPANLQVRAGQLLTEYGRQNTLHPHSWGFVDSPIVLARFLGPDGLRNPGARVSWLVPTDFYSELFFTIQDSHGETAASFRGGGDHEHGAAESELPFAYRHADNDRGVSAFTDLLLTPRYAFSFDLTDTQTLLAGVSAAFGPNNSGQEGGGDTTTQVYGIDFMWKWKSPTHNAGFPFVAVQAEGLVRRYEAGAFNWDLNGDGIVDPGEVSDTRTGGPADLAPETLLDYGLYAQLLYGFRKGWVAGFRFDYASGDEADYERYTALDNVPLGRDPQRAERWRLSPNLTWYPSEFSKVRLQYNYDRRSVEGDDHSVWLQFEFLLGAHAAHKF